MPTQTETPQPQSAFADLPTQFDPEQFKGVERTPKEQIFDQRYELVEVPFGTARPASRNNTSRMPILVMGCSRKTPAIVSTRV